MQLYYKLRLSYEHASANSTIRGGQQFSRMTSQTSYDVSELASPLSRATTTSEQEAGSLIVIGPRSVPGSLNMNVRGYLLLFRRVRLQESWH